MRRIFTLMMSYIRWAAMRPGKGWGSEIIDQKPEEMHLPHSRIAAQRM